MTDYLHEERKTDDMIDAGLCAQCGAVSGVNHLCVMGSGGTSQLPPLTQAEIDAQRVRPFRKAWDIDRFKRPGRVVNGMCEHGACDWCPHGCFDDAQRPMTDAERKRIIDKIHRDIDAMKREDDAQRVQPDVPGAAA